MNELRLPTTPPASTSEIALARYSGDATSAAANRYCNPTALYTPMMQVAKQKSGKLRHCSASVPMMQPTMLIAAPVMNPRRRPTFPIHSAIGIAATADPSTYVVAPKVASDLFCASANPTSPFIEISPDALVSNSAWQQARRKISRREVCTIVAGDRSAARGAKSV